jgi:hypothetical protein
MDEEEYFARENAEKLRKLHKEQMKGVTSAERDRLKQLHANRCPSCGMEMSKLPPIQGVTLLRCFECGGTFIDPEVAKKLQGHSTRQEHKIVNAILSWFTHEEPKR